MKSKSLKRSMIIAGLLGGALTAKATEDSLNQPPTPHPELDDIQLGKLNTALPTYLAAHRSHASHSSHGSHRSSAGSTAPRAPAAPRTVAPSPPPAATSDPLGQPPRPDQSVPDSQTSISAKQQLLNQRMADAANLKNIIMRVQLTLQSIGIYGGTIDGVMGPATREAVNRFRLNNGIPVSDRLDVITLDALGISVY